MTNIARDGAPKSLDPITPNPGMHHTAKSAERGQPGLIATGVSRTKSAELLGANTPRSDDSANTAPKSLTPVTIHPSMAADRVDRGHHVEGQGETVLQISPLPVRKPGC